MKPTVSFRLNKNLDKMMALQFLSFEAGGVDFSKGVTAYHPELEKVKEIGEEEKRKEFVSDYFDDFYEEHKDDLEKIKGQFAKDWKKVEEKFLKETKGLFNGYSFPDGDYIGYLSVINCNPRFLQNKTFQIFYKNKDGVEYTTAHELLHFVFYDYAQENYPDLFQDLDPERGLFWDLAELFNSVVLHTPEFAPLHSVDEQKVYPQHEKYISKFESLWNKYKGVDEFIKEGYEILSKSSAQ